MNKLLKTSSVLIAMLVSIPACFGMSKTLEAKAVDITGDLYGSARIKCVTQSGTDVGYVTEININNGNGDYSGTGVYIRMKNYTGVETPITTKFNSTNGAIFGPKTGVNQTYYDKNGNPTTGSTARGWGNYMMLPANFDGFIYMDYSTQMSRIEGDADFDPSHMWRVYIEYSGHYDSYAEFAIGDIFTDTRQVLDTSELSETGFSATFINQTGAAQSVTQNEKAPTPPFDYTQVAFGGALENGVNITAKKNTDSSVFSTASINFPSNLDLSSGEAVAINMSCAGTIAFGLEFYDKDNNALMMPAAGDATEKPIPFIVGDTSTSMNHTTGDPNTIHEVAGTGVLVAQKNYLAQKTGTTFDWSHVKGLKVRVHTFFDFALNIVMGDIGTVNQTALTHTIVFAVADIATWSSVYHADDEFIVVTQFLHPVYCDWIGDVKVMNPLIYENDEEMKQEVFWDPGDNACTYEAKEDGMFVHIGPFEVGHANGNYMALVMPDTGKVSDRAQFWKMENEQKVFAKGITAYVKNLSNKEIGITIQFDEDTGETLPGTTSPSLERWCITGYPAMYYAWDVKTGAEYSFFCKSDQFQIPVGFEGYVRIPFESFNVPEWCKNNPGVDQELNLDKWNGTFFLTSDNTRYEDLEFSIKNIGAYFNETRRGNLFDNSHTIKANMGL